MTTTHEAIMPTPPADHSTLTAIGGWVVAVVGLLGTLAKLPYDRAVARDRLEEERRREQFEHTQEIEIDALGDSKAARAEVAAELRRQVATHEDRIARLEGQLAAVLDERAQLLAQIARLETELAASLRETERLRAARDHYRALALEGTEAARQAGSVHAQTLDDEISEADEATSKAGGP